MNLIIRASLLGAFICCVVTTFARTGNLPIGFNVRDFGARGDGKTLDTNPSVRRSTQLPGPAVALSFFQQVPILHIPFI